ncbi:MAG: GtrA family protein [Acidimicrobiaceae bacterium]|nr:GtrA family protein [Acidimicrobiaceae bacterium]
MEAVRGHRTKALRYCAVSVVNVLVGLSTLAFALEVLHFAPLTANLTSWMISTTPAYLLSRYWVWQQFGNNSVKSEIVPFWIIALVGLVLSSVSVVALASITDNTLIVLLGAVAAYGVVWVAKYLILDGLLWPKPIQNPEEPIAEVA